MPQPALVNGIADPLGDAYQRAWRRILAEQQRLVDDPVRWVRRRRLEEMSRRIADITRGLDRDMTRWVAREFPRAYAAGLTVSAPRSTWTGVHQQAVQTMANGLHQDLLAATSNVNTTTKNLIRTIARDEHLQALIEGRTADQAGREMARLVERHGIHSVVYRDGSRHGLGEYAQMATRTNTAIAYNTGTLNGAPDVLYFEVFDGPDCGWSFHEDPDLAMGMIVDRNEAMTYPISHPNCRRAFGPRPDITDTSPEVLRPLQEDPLTVGSGQTTIGQRAAQMSQDQVRSARQARVARSLRQARRARTAR